MHINSAKAAQRLSAMLAYFKRIKRLPFLSITVKSLGDACYTDGRTITIGAEFSLFKKAANTKEVFAMMAGATFHELGHVFYTPFRILVQSRRYIHEGLFWPRNPAGSGRICKYAVESEKNAARLYSTYANLINILEDPRIEYLMLTLNGRYGIFCSGLKLLRTKMEEGQDVFSEVVSRIDSLPEERRAEANFAELFNLILYYGRFGRIKGIAKEEYNHPLAVKMLEIADLISDATKATTAEEFFGCTNEILVACFDDYILPYYESINEEEEDINREHGGDGKTGSSAVEKALGSVKDKAQGDTRNSGINDTSIERQMQGEKNQARREMRGKAKAGEGEEKGTPNPDMKIDRKETTEITGGESGGTELQEVDIENINALDVSAIESVEKAAGNAPVRNYDETLKAPDIDYGSAHDGIKVIVRRGRIRCGESEYSTYDRFVNLGRKTGELIKPLLQKENKAYWQQNRFFGTRFAASKAANPNLRHFGRKVVKKKSPTVAFGVLVDCSGSMYGTKIEMARAMAVTCYETCKAAEVDFGVFGHHTEGMDVVVDNYVYFDEKDDFAKYRLLSIKADGANRDGAAIRYVAEKLSEVKADRKILIIISDGQPAHSGYGGTAAEEDIRRIIKEYKAKNVSFIAAAIDEDKERIKGIYGRERFLAIDNPDKIPEEILKVIRRAIFA